jgi:intracellular sulfur oxidation DsrE/DsrF family protein
MQMAIDKAKKHGVGFVACRNSTVRFNFLSCSVHLQNIHILLLTLVDLVITL